MSDRVEMGGYEYERFASGEWRRWGRTGAGTLPTEPYVVALIEALLAARAEVEAWKHPVITRTSDVPERYVDLHEMTRADERERIRAALLAELHGVGAIPSMDYERAIDNACGPAPKEPPA